MNFNTFFTKLIVAYGIYKGIKYLVNGDETNEGKSEDANFLRNSLMDVEKILKEKTDVLR